MPKRSVTKPYRTKKSTKTKKRNVSLMKKIKKGFIKNKKLNWKVVAPVILVFALVGGYFVYSSFAYPAHSFNFTSVSKTANVNDISGGTAKTKESGYPYRELKDKSGSNQALTANVSSAQYIKSSEICVRYLHGKGSLILTIPIQNANGQTTTKSERLTMITETKGKEILCIPTQGVASGKVTVKADAGSTGVATSNVYTTVDVIYGTLGTPIPVTPNPTGSSRCPAYPKFPDASCTGTLPGVPRTNSGSITTSRDGQVIENLNINGEIRVVHNNVTIRNVKITSNGGNAINIFRRDEATPYKNLLVEDCELDGQDGNAEPAIALWNYTMRRCNIHDYGEGPRSVGNVLLEDNYIHDFANFIPQGAHADAFQATSGDNTTLRHNTVLIGEDWDGATTFDGANGSIFFSTYDGNNILIEKNLAGGGNWAIQVDKSRYTNVTIRDNHITTKVPLHPKGGYFGPIDTDSAFKIRGNVWHDGPNAGQLAVPNNY